MGFNTTLALNRVISSFGKTLTKTDLGQLILGGTAADAFSGLTIVSTGALKLNKTAGVNAIGGDVTVGVSGALSLSAANQISDAALVTVGGV